jgi:hypothetical protein
MDKVQPEFALKHNPTARLNLEKVMADERKAKQRMHPLPCANNLPPGLEDFLPRDLHEHKRMIAVQQRIEEMIQQGREQGPGAVGLGAGMGSKRPL